MAIRILAPLTRIVAYLQKTLDFRSLCRPSGRGNNNRMSTQQGIPPYLFDPSEAVHGDRFLTPVYFHRQVLTRYLYDSRFSCDFASETYGTIHGPDFSISFGINRHGSVIAWLGDLKNMPDREQLYWLVENKAPEREVASEFYDSQIEVEYTSPPAVVQCLNELATLNASFHRRFGVHLYHDRSIEERIDETKRYKRLMFNNVDDLKRFVSELNEIINENTNNAGLRKLLADRGMPAEAGTKGNKLLQSVYESVLGDRSNLIAPFFYLYDLRLWADHSAGDKYLQEVSGKLNVAPERYADLMEALIAAIRRSVHELHTKVDH
jgi:hypothetical protein